MKEKHFASMAGLLASIACAAAMLLILYVPSPVGVANNGDFLRVIHPAGIRYVDGNPNKDKFVQKFVMEFKGGTNFQKFQSVFERDYGIYDYYTSQTYPVLASKAMNVVWNRILGQDENIFNVFFLALIYIAMTAAGIGLAVHFIWKRYGTALGVFSILVFLFVFCDQGYLLYLNSFYGEAMQYSATMLCVGLFLKLAERRSGPVLHILYWVCAIGMGLSKMAFAPTGMLFAALPLLAHSGYKRLFVLIGSVASCVALLYCITQLSPSWIEEDTSYNTVFAGILRYSSNPEKDLQDLGLDPEYAALKGTESYQTDYPIDIKTEEFKEGFFEKISKGKVLLFYLTHTTTLWKALQESMSYAKRIRPIHLANTENPAEPHEQSYRFSIWETLRLRSPMNNIPVFLVCCALILALAIQSKSLALGGLITAIAASAGINFVLPIMGNGICDIAKHMYGFITFYDMMLFILVGVALKRGFFSRVQKKG
ncbi:MAG: hypothetical protein LBC41_09190 [Clostridiales bacterium]|nr:hypothetical protein [Clostridiales bacterium]